MLHYVDGRQDRGTAKTVCEALDSKLVEFKNEQEWDEVSKNKKPSVPSFHCADFRSLSWS